MKELGRTAVGREQSMLHVLWKHPRLGMWSQERCQNALARGLEPGDKRTQKPRIGLCTRAEGCIQPDALVCDMGQMVNVETFGGIPTRERESVLSAHDSEEHRDREGEPRTERACRRGTSPDQCSVAHPVWQ